jgi:hypothetical protein
MTDTIPTSNERRKKHRFAINAPITVRVSGHEVTGFTQNLSDQGAYFYLDQAKNLAEGSDFDFHVDLPPEITLACSCSIRCRGRVLRVEDSVQQMTGIAAEILQYSIQ